MKTSALEEIKKVLEEELEEPLRLLKQLLEPFQQAYDFFIQTVKNIKEAWRVIRNGYQTARTLLEEIFGPKMHEDWPRKLLESSSCGDGFWESDGKGHYANKGIMLEVSVGQPIVAPYGGKLEKTGPREVTITVNEMKSVKATISNVDLNVDETEASLPFTQVAAGEILGQGITPTWCRDPHVHVALVKIDKGTVVDPTSYLRKRKMPPPRWVQECDLYTLRWLDETVSQGKILGEPDQSDTTPPIDGTTEYLNVDVMEDTDRKKRGTSELIDKINDFAKSLGLPDLTKLKDVFNFNMNSITLNKILGYLDYVGLSTMKTKIINILKEIEKRTNHQSCINPETMDVAGLKQALVTRGQATSGARQTLINRYLSSDPQCFDIGSRVGPNVYCRFDKSCTSVSCCVDLKLFIYRHTLTAFVRYDPCDLELTIGVNTWTGSFKVFEHDFKECMSPIVIMSEAKIEIGVCVTNVILPLLTRPADTPSVDEMLNMKIGDVIKLVDVSGVDEKQMTELVEDLREAFKQWLTKQINDLVVKIFANDFERFDICMTGPVVGFGPYFVPILDYPPIVIFLGPVPVWFRFGVDGFYGAKFTCRLCLMSMKLTPKIVPRLGCRGWGSATASIWLVEAELRLDGYILSTSFPVTITVEFKKFPIEVRARMDLNLIAVRLELRGILTFRFCIYIPWKGKKCWTKRYNKLLWTYQTDPINKELWNYNDAEPDKTPPDFGWYNNAKCGNCEEDSSTVDNGDDTSASQRKRRAIGPSGTGCHVAQIAGRDYTEPAFTIELGVADDRSEVELSYCVGTFSGGCDVVDNEPLGGETSVVVRTLVHSIHLYFSVKAQNSMGLSAVTSCELPTYDMTLPEGRITPDFRSTSHRELLQGSALALDDSVIRTHQISAGYGKGSHGAQIADWQSVDSVKATSRVDTGSDPLGLRVLEHFTAPREGRLVAPPVETTRYQFAAACARHCLSLPDTVCRSFNYDYDYDSATAGVCELMNRVEERTIHVRQSGRFHHFERRGIGHVTYARFTHLRLAHNTTIYLNYYLRNILGYTNIISSSGVLVDLTPPAPGMIKNEASDSFTHDSCSNYVPTLWRQRCAPETNHPTHRTIVDGEGSLTIFNGHEPGVDNKYTRANRMITANWDGIHDHETGMLMYTWAVGTSPCGDDIVTHNDPHEHIASASEWTNVGLAFPLNLPDGKYYVTVRGINDIEFGPLALSVCHAQPFAIDTTPPIIYEVYDLAYDEDSFLISFRMNATDPVSGIKVGEVGLGRSRRDTYLLPWTTVQNYSHVEHKFRVPDGVPAWVKMRVTNNVELRAVGHSAKAIIVDISPPLPGLVYDGNDQGGDIAFQSSSARYCASWHDFRDPESGISKYLFDLGTTPGSADVVANIAMPYTVTSHCVDGLQLQHKRVYYSSVTAFNGAISEKNVSVSSDGVYVDVTPPLKGIVKDGNDPNSDEIYSSEPSTVSSAWREFSDPESGIKRYSVDVYKTSAGSNSKESIIYATVKVDPSVNSMVRHHFHLHHGDFVRVDVTATNKAESSTSVTSNGVKIDLTEPKMSQLVDGGDLSDDMQYTDSSTSLTASWSFVDPESGIDHYKISAHELHGGKWTRIYPISTHWKIVPGNATTWTTDEALTLKIGALYKTQVSAVNGAGLTAAHYTNGVLVDPTPPQMIFVHAGVLSGESEELLDGYVIHNDENGIIASWSASDVESGIGEYLVGIGTKKGTTDLLEFRSMGISKDGYINKVTLALTDALTNIPLYYITVKSRNGAGKESSVLSSSPIKVVSGDVAGVVRDGPDIGVDIDYQLDVSTVTVTFGGYESQRDGVSRYEWAIGSAPRLDDVMPYSDIDLVTDDGGPMGMLGIGGSGKGQGQLPLSAAVKYYTTVRAVTGAGNVLESASDGILVDVTAPVAGITSLGGKTLNRTDARTESTEVLYQKEADSYTVGWDVDDRESGVSGVWFRMGTYLGAGNIHPKTWIGNATILPNNLVKPHVDGQPNIVTLDATNGVDLPTTVVSRAVTFDKTAPLPGSVICPESVQGGDSLECSWIGFIEKESEVSYYTFGVGTTEGDDSVYASPHLEAGTCLHRAKVFFWKSSTFKDDGSDGVDEPETAGDISTVTTPSSMLSTIDLRYFECGAASLVISIADHRLGLVAAVECDTVISSTLTSASASMGTCHSSSCAMQKLFRWTSEWVMQGL
ncbi:hypothetical protein NP493_1368g00012 [Ridgeia piscesae]|uniref:Apple domain-containing protein n=1 Tax=Ridgeia piscesae TaxID=27915 RepID=A0AAD9NF92_RIDPI|nr:hypothetical protein NP493_1368g00012 [Ridgeia piscesae]